jgi:hypothetical protein
MGSSGVVLVESTDRQQPLEMSRALKSEILASQIMGSNGDPAVASMVRTSSFSTVLTANNKH